MKIKRYMAVSMRVALAQVRAEQGPDAVILSSRRVEEGIEVIAAVDYDEALFVDATLKRPAAPLRAQPSRGLPPPGPPGIEWVKLTDQEDPIRPVLREPLQARVIEALTAMDIAPDIAAALAAQTPQRTALKDPSHIPLALLVKHLRVVDKLSPVNGGLIALVGPTGAGKTTTIGKLAARWSMQHGSQDLALVSTDSYRIGAREQLTAYARILGAPMHAANSGKELAQVLERLKTKKLVLIDTAGMGPRDTRLTEQIAALQLGAARARVLLTLPAHGEAHAMDEIVRSFARMSPVACVLTKLDEAASLGAVISTALRHRLRIAYLCNGQRVPEDLHAAHEKRVWLVRSAVKLKEHARPRVDDGHFARNVTGAQAHA